jgi:hypothetical protein
MTHHSETPRHDWLPVDHAPGKLLARPEPLKPEPLPVGDAPGRLS